jgi:hypothetical protein
MRESLKFFLMELPLVAQKTFVRFPVVNKLIILFVLFSALNRLHTFRVAAAPLLRAAMPFRFGLLCCLVGT